MASAVKSYRVRRKLEAFYTGGAVRLSQDGSLLACSCADEVKLVDVASGAVLRTIEGDSEPITALALSPDARLLFAASRSLQLRCWAVGEEGGGALRSFRGHKAPVADMAVDASGGLLATASADRSVRVWDVDGGFCTHAFTGHSGVVLRVLFHPKQLMAVSGGDDAEVRVWDLVTKSCAAVLKGHFSAVTSLSLSPDGWTLVSGGRDSVAIVWSMRDHSKLATIPVYEPLEGVAYLPPGLAFPGLPAPGSAKGGRGAPACFATGGERGVVRLWRADTGKCVYEQPASAAVAAAAAGGIVELAMLPGGAGLLTATQDCRLLFNRPAGGQLAVDRQLIGNNDEVTDLRFLTLPAAGGGSHGGGGGGGGEGGEGGAAADAQQAQPQAQQAQQPTHLAVSTNSDQIRIFDADTLSCTATLTGHTDTVLALDALRLPPPAGGGGGGGLGPTLLASGSKDASVRLWSLPDARCVGVGAGHVSSVGCVAFARRGGGFVASGGADKLLKVWDFKGLDLAAAAAKPAKLRVTAAVAAHDKDINAVAVAPNDSIIVTGSQDRTAKVWRLPNLVLAQTLKGHKRGVWAVAFSPIDQAVATASGDKTVRLWSLADGACLRTFEGHLASVLRLDFLSAGTQLVSAGADGLIKLWSVRLSECINTFDAHDDKVWALSLSGPSGALLASGGGDGAVAVWEDCTAADADEAAAEAAAAVLKQQDLANALQDEDYQRAAALAFEMRHPGRLLSVVRQALERGAEGPRILGRLAAGMGPEDLRQCLEYVREWNVNAKHCHAAQAMLQAVLRQRRPQDLLAVPGLSGLLEGLLPYTQRHFARADRLLRSTFLGDYILASGMQVLTPEEQQQEEGGGGSGEGQAAAAGSGAQPQAALQGQQQGQAQPRRQRPVRALLGGAPPVPAPAAGRPQAEQQQEQEQQGAAAAASAQADGAPRANGGHAGADSGSSSSDEDEDMPDVVLPERQRRQQQPQQQADGLDSQPASEQEDEQQPAAAAAAKTPKARKAAAAVGTAAKSAAKKTRAAAATPAAAKKGRPEGGKAKAPPATASKAAAAAAPKQKQKKRRMSA